MISIREKLDAILPYLNERSIRLWCAIEARSYGAKGITAVHKATGVSRPTIYAGLKELDEGSEIPSDRLRRKGGGRKSLSKIYPKLLEELEDLLEPASRGDPMSPLRWTCKSTYKLSSGLKEKGYSVSASLVRSLLKQLGYSLQSNRKKREDDSHPDRDAQFNHIARQSQEFQSEGLPVISVDTKKKELIGNYKNSGQEYAPKKNPVAVNTYDFPDKDMGKVSPYGVYDIGSNKGWISVGISSDTAEFAVNTIRSWWYGIGRKRYPEAGKLMITADSGGSNSYRSRLWKVSLQRLATELGIDIQVCHFPPGTSKWNKIEHKMFSYISKNWRRRPLINIETVINLIANTKTEKGLKIISILDENHYEKGIKITDKQLSDISITRHNFHAEWNYLIKPIS